VRRDIDDLGFESGALLEHATRPGPIDGDTRIDNYARMQVAGLELREQLSFNGDENLWRAMSLAQHDPPARHGQAEKK
jgi:hypothetical protein